MWNRSYLTMVIYQAAISAIYPGLTSKKRKVIPKHVYIVKLGDKLNYNDDPSPNLRNIRDGRIIAHPYCCAARPQSSWLPPSRSINGGAALFYFWSHAYLLLLHLLPRNPFAVHFAFSAKIRSGSFVSPRPTEFSASKNIQLLWTPLINCNRLCISPLIPPFNKPYSELGRAGLHTFPWPNNAVHGRLTSIS